MIAATTLWHTAIIGQFMVILAVGAYLQHGYRTAIRLMSPRLFWMGYAYGFALLATALAVAVNVATATAPTPGARALCVLLAPVTAACVVALVRTLRDRLRRPNR